MNFEALLGTVLKRLNSRLMNFPDPTDDTLIPAAVPGKNYLLYLHIPYCISLCPFCSFHRVKFAADSALQYFACLRREIRMHEELGYRFDAVYIGGGTPTVLPHELSKTICDVRARHPITSISVETNPDHLKLDAVQRLQDAGVDRLSVGVQSFDDNLLKAMRRFDTYGSGAEIAERLKSVRDKFNTVNVDMIFNLPGQTESSLSRDLDVLVDDINADQVSFYPLMSSDSTRGQMSRTMGSTDFSNQQRYYENIVDRMLNAGYVRASAWCFSRQAGMFDEYVVEREEYVGLGSGSFSYLQGSLYLSSFSIPEYVRMIESGLSGTVVRRELPERDQMRYYLLMKMFAGALNKTQAEARFNDRFQRVLWPELAGLHSVGAIRNKGELLELTERGFYIWIILMREFFSGINNLREQARQHTEQPRVAVRATE